jgi:hypothetical protein
MSTSNEVSGSAGKHAAKLLLRLAISVIATMINAEPDLARTEQGVKFRRVHKRSALRQTVETSGPMPIGCALRALRLQDWLGKNMMDTSL